MRKTYFCNQHFNKNDTAILLNG